MFFIMYVKSYHVCELTADELLSLSLAGKMDKYILEAMWKSYRKNSILGQRIYGMSLLHNGMCTLTLSPNTKALLKEVYTQRIQYKQIKLHLWLF